MTEENHYPIAVSPEAFSSKSDRLQSVDAVGHLADLDDLRQQLAEQARKLGGDLVCELQVIPLGMTKKRITGQRTIKVTEPGEFPEDPWESWDQLVVDEVDEPQVLVTGLAVKSDQLLYIEERDRIDNAKQLRFGP